MINLEKKTKELEGINFVAFSNNVVVVNTTPHPVTIQDMDGTLITVPTSVLINAKAEERKVSDLFVRTEFVGTEEGKETIERIKSVYNRQFSNGTLVIVGSIIAAQAYPGEVAAMTPVEGYERVAPDQKRMRCDKFTTFAYRLKLQLGGNHYEQGRQSKAEINQGSSNSFIIRSVNSTPFFIGCSKTYRSYRRQYPSNDRHCIFCFREKYLNSFS